MCQRLLRAAATHGDYQVLRGYNVPPDAVEVDTASCWRIATFRENMQNIKLPTYRSVTFQPMGRHERASLDTAVICYDRSVVS